MSYMNTAGQPNDGSMQQAFVEHFAAAASAVLSQIAGSRLQAKPVPLRDAVEAATLVRVEISGELEGVCELALAAPMAARFASLLTGEAPGEIGDDAREAAAELMQQICGNAADRLRAAFGSLELKARAAEREAHNGATSAPGQRQLLCIDRGEDSSREDSLQFELNLLRLAARPRVAQNSAPASAAPATDPASAQAREKADAPIPAAPPSGNRNLDLLLDFELGVTLRFGTRHMLLKEILELCSGSVVELDRRVEEPVDLLIDGRVIAQGEVVIIEGNYGLRILQVASQGEKLACLP